MTIGPSGELVRRAQIALLRESLDRPPGDRARASALVTAATLLDEIRRLVDHLDGPEAEEASDGMLRTALELWSATRGDRGQTDEALVNVILSALGELR